MKSFHKISFTIALSVLPQFAQTQESFNSDYLSVFELVDECDLLAAHPNDGQRMSDGIPDGALIPRLAEIACSDAVELYPEISRFRFQLARALDATGRKDAAFEELTIASDQNYAAASAMLGQYVMENATSPEEAQIARSLFEAALNGGFNDADLLLASATPNSQVFVAQSILRSLYSGSPEGLSAAKSDVRIRSYLFNFTSTLMESCEGVLSPHAIPGLYLFRFPGGQIEQETNDVSVEIQAEVGSYDASTFVSRHGCEGFFADTVFRTLDAFFKG